MHRPSAARSRAAPWAALILALALAGCASLQPSPTAPAAPQAPPTEPPPPPVPMPEPPPPAPPAPTAQDLADAATRELLAHHDQLSRLPAIQWPAEQARLQALLGDRTPLEQPAAALKLAQLLGRQARSGDLPRALALAEPLTRAEAPSPWQDAARWLHAHLAEQRAQEDQIERLTQQLREQQRRLEQLQAQIEALRAIERSLGTRPAAP